ncbi:uncharacterized protein LOC143360299 [Halictus rubicundus]|uniref:uncharacterized protein LOC143360299 n=1 Tax=Halictus rubicundus TaxID=77578 RepID=UPI0040370C67
MRQWRLNYSGTPEEDPETFLARLEDMRKYSNLEDADLLHCMSICYDFPKYPLTIMSSILDKLRAARYISTLDLSQAYFQIPLEESSSEMEPHAFAYLDDIIIATSTFKENLAWLTWIFRRIKAAGMIINPEKCEFCRGEVPVVGQQARKRTPEKERRKRTWPLLVSNTINPELWDKVDRLSYEQALKVHTIRTQKQKEKFNKLQVPKTQAKPLKNTVINLTNSPLSTDEESVLSKAIHDIKKRKDILVLPADKGNTTVVINKDDYIKKARDLLDDTTYRTLRKDPTKTLERITTTIIKQAKLPDHVHKTIIPKESKAPRLYGLPKIHKPDIPLRPIVSTIGSPTYKLAKYLTNILKPLTGSTPSYIKNSSHFIHKIQTIQTQPEDLLVSFDVKSLFTNVPITDSIEIIKNKIPENLIPLVKHCLTSTYFLFQDTYYKQISGAAMGSPISPIIADIYMEDLENRILKNAPRKPTQWFNVDDTFVVWSHGRDTLDDFLHYINSLHPNIQFTMEIENEDKSLPFLTVLVTRKINGSLGHRVYMKPTHTNRYLHASSHHHPAQKNSVLNSLINRAISITESQHLPQELDYLRTALI